MWLSHERFPGILRILGNDEAAAEGPENESSQGYNGTRRLQHRWHKTCIRAKGSAPLASNSALLNQQGVGTHPRWTMNLSFVEDMG